MGSTSSTTFITPQFVPQIGALAVLLSQCRFVPCAMARRWVPECGSLARPPHYLPSPESGLSRKSQNLDRRAARFRVDEDQVNRNISRCGPHHRGCIWRSCSLWGEIGGRLGQLSLPSVWGKVGKRVYFSWFFFSIKAGELSGQDGIEIYTLSPAFSDNKPQS